MTVPPRRQCPARRVQSTSHGREYEALLIILLEPTEDGGRPASEAYYKYADPFYACIEGDVCQCELAPPSQRGKVDAVIPGGRFDGRIAGLRPPEGDANDEAVFERNCVPVTMVCRPVSCYAVITPDGLWHECFEPEARDLVVSNGATPDDHDRLTRVQVAWRYEVDHLLGRYRRCWALGCTAYLPYERVWRRCDHERAGREA